MKLPFFIHSKTQKKNPKKNMKNKTNSNHTKKKPERNSLRIIIYFLVFNFLVDFENKKKMEINDKLPFATKKKSKEFKHAKCDAVEIPLFILLVQSIGNKINRNSKLVNSIMKITFLQFHHLTQQQQQRQRH